MSPRELAWSQVVVSLLQAMSSFERLRMGAFEDRLFEERRIAMGAADAAEWGRKAVARSLKGPLVPGRKTA